MQLHFICQGFTVEQLLRCSFNLNETGLRILKYLIDEKEEKTIEEIKKVMKKDRTTVQRAVKNLFREELIHRRQINLNKGGYIFVYKSAPKKELKEKIYKIFESFKETVGKEIQRW